jgi:hypothetical protein
MPVAKNRSGETQYDASSVWLQKLEHKVSNEPCLFDMQKVANLVVELKLSARRKERFDVSASALPPHRIVLNSRQHAKERHFQCCEVVERPAGTPRAKTAEMQHRIDLPSPPFVVVTGADSDEVFKPLTRKSRIHRLTPFGQALDRVRTPSELSATSTAIKSRSQVGATHSTTLTIVDIRRGELGRKAIEIYECSGQRRTAVEKVK